MRKTCFICFEEKDLSEYYKHPQMGDGHLNKCKECTKKHSKQRFDEKIQDPVFLESERARGREKYHRLEYKGLHYPDRETKKESIKRYNEKYPEKAKCRSFCSKHYSKKEGFNFHHWSYNREHWYDTIELSIEQHNKLHRYLIYDQERMMYRRIDTLELLDSRELHLEYYKSLSEKP